MSSKVTSQCWINSKYEPLRLYTHYLWIFVAEFGSVFLYAIVGFRLRRTITQTAILGDKRAQSLRRVVRHMAIYPIAYVVLSLPLAAGRMAMVRGFTPSPAYFCAAAAIITSSGVVDVTIYTLTRGRLVTDSAPSYGHSRDHFGISSPRKHNDVGQGSLNLVPYELTTFEVTSEQVYPSQVEASVRSSKDSEGNSPPMPPTTSRI